MHPAHGLNRGLGLTVGCVFDILFISLPVRFSFDRITETTGSDKGGKRIKNKLRDVFVEKLLCYPACQQCQDQQNGADLTKRAAFVFE
jgi:hypothetical protein